MQTKKTFLKKINKEWGSFYQKNRLKWVTNEGLEKPLNDFLKHLSFKDIEIDFLRDGYVNEDYYIDLYDVTIISIVNGEKVEITISNVDSETNSGSEHWVTEGSIEFIDTSCGLARMRGGTIESSNKYLHETEETIQKALLDFNLQGKLESESRDLHREKNQKEVQEKEKGLQGNLKIDFIEKTKDTYTVHFTNGAKMYGITTITLP